MNPEYKLPEAFTERMKAQMGGEYASFLAGYNEPAWHGLRANRLKIVSEALPPLLPFPLTPVRWCADGFTNPPDARPAKTWAYHAGLFYIQEPSAMCPASVLNAQPGDCVLDLCAAPGGKSVQLAGQLQGQGVLVANDASASRCGALVKNLELAGVTNAVVLKETPKKLAERFTAFFDKVLVDAPCSGEGMFRRDVEAAKGWAINKPEACVRMQREILHYAADMVKPGGHMVYSTCTFGPEENEQIIDVFLTTRPDYELLPIPHEKLGLSQACPAWGGGRESLINAARIWPHRAQGEGHFIALMGRKADLYHSSDVKRMAPVESPAKKLLKPFYTFCDETLNKSFDWFLQKFLCNQSNDKSSDWLLKNNNGTLILHEQSLFLSPAGVPGLRGLRIARGGWHLGELKPDRFIPSQALAMGLRKEEAQFSVNLPDEDIARYLRGETVTLSAGSVEKAVSGNGEMSGYKAWVLVCAGGYPLGWGRLMDGYIKNQLPRGWVMA